MVAPGPSLAAADSAVSKIYPPGVWKQAYGLSARGGFRSMQSVAAPTNRTVLKIDMIPIAVRNDSLERYFPMFDLLFARQLFLRMIVYCCGHCPVELEHTQTVFPPRPDKQ